MPIKSANVLIKSINVLIKSANVLIKSVSNLPKCRGCLNNIAIALANCLNKI